MGMNFWEKDRKAGMRVKGEELKIKEHIIRGARQLLPESKKLFNEIKEHFAQDNYKMYAVPDGAIDKFFDFRGPESLDEWVVTTDSDNDGGFSTANLSISPFGHGTFTGNLSNRVPKTGIVKNAGYVNLRYVPPLKAFGREDAYVWVAYTHLVLRVRGDGRTFLVNIHPHTDHDTHWLDMWSYVLHTRGGPYWQETWLPFSKFFLHHRGRIQDKQWPVELDCVKNISITLADTNEGHFNLEIDYIGCGNDLNHQEKFAYESYYVPRWTAY